MQLKRRIWGFLLTAIFIGCTTDDSPVIEKELKLNVKLNKNSHQFIDAEGDILNPPNSEDEVNTETEVSIEREDQNSTNNSNTVLGMPIEGHSIYGFDVIGVKYPSGTIYNSLIKDIVRQEFYEKYPELRLILSTDSDVFISPDIDYWLVKSNLNQHDVDVINIDSADGRDEDGDRTHRRCGECPNHNSAEHLHLINTIKQDIQSNDPDRIRVLTLH